MAGELTVGFIGAGKMALGIASGLLLSGNVKPENVIASAPSNNNLYKFKEAGMQTTHCNTSVVESCHVLFLSVKPSQLPGVLKEISPFVTPAHLIVSVAAGVTIETLEKLLPVGTKVLRMMPNLPCVVQEGSMVFCRGSCAREQDGAVLKGLVSSCGLCEETPESYIDIHTGLSGSGVAYVYLFAAALTEGGVKMGMPYELSKKMVAQTLLGAAKMILGTEDHLEKLKSDVCTPGGTTIHGLYELEKGNLRCTVMNAVEAATNRARELGKN
ncbi:pyrroline-5-carboxylate reductase 3 [Rhincodon typus]|uniref:pyrroline-5-carboxylate reductase 3 n=1 Tax=Rhincodon typus TaxID=259920 RepID=UPI00202EB961|nr:pyrroline-5-carboxylate reductase 3 [Rhincodon typus]